MVLHKGGDPQGRLLTMLKLGVNIDHVATLREARGGEDPEPAFAAMICETAGADSIVAHLREDRRHMKERDVCLLREMVRTRLNLEMSIDAQIVSIACRLKPDQATLVPEKRKELTTEGGLDVAGNPVKIKNAVRKLQDKGIAVSLFIDPERKQIDAARKAGASRIEIHTGQFARGKSDEGRAISARQIKAAADYAEKQNIAVCAGHGLDYHNVKMIVPITQIEELNIGHAIICRAVLVGLAQAVSEMKALLER